MKKALIVGANSYIGISFERYVNGRIDVTTISSHGDVWQEIDYSGFDSVVFVAGIAHRKNKGADSDLYYFVNRDLAFETVKKAKAEGVRQFIYISSIYAGGIYKGEVSPQADKTPKSSDHYGLSKQQAEALLLSLQSENFRVAVIRPPMVYGPRCKGNFPELIKLVKKLPFFPTLQNKRSMIFVDNLSEFLAIVIEQEISGVLCPRNKEYVSTARMMEEIAKQTGSRYRPLPLLNPLVRMLMPLYPPLKNAFVSLFYSDEAPDMPFDRAYQAVGFEESIKRSVAGYE